MKKLLLTLALAVGAINSGFAADLYVNNSGQSGTYTSIQTALNVASSGDRIFVSPYGVYSENLTISKSVTIAPSLSGSNIVLNGDIVIWPFANDHINLVGISGKGVSLTTNTISATVNTKALIELISCEFVNTVDLDHEAVDVNALYSTIHYLNLTYGKVIGNRITHSIRIYDGPNTLLGDTNLVIANFITYDITMENNDNLFRISNNICRYISINTPVFHSNLKNYVTNNYCSWYNGTLYGIRVTYSNTTDNYSNLIIQGNIVHHINTDGNSNGERVVGLYLQAASSTTLTSSNSPLWYYNLIMHSESNTYGCTNNSYEYNTNLTGSLTQGYNEQRLNTQNLKDIWLIDPNSPTKFLVQNLSPNDQASFTDIAYFKDKAPPTTEYFDLDLSRGDLGPWGGEFSMENYWIGQTNGKARIFISNLPSEIWPGQTVNLKAEAVHTN
jgi:hypothetical protein